MKFFDRRYLITPTERVLFLIMFISLLTGVIKVPYMKSVFFISYAILFVIILFRNRATINKLWMIVWLACITVIVTFSLYYSIPQLSFLQPYQAWVLFSMFGLMIMYNKLIPKQLQYIS